MADFSALFEDLKGQIGELAKDTLGDFLEQAKQDGQDALGRIGGDITNWANLASSGKLSNEDVRFLVEGEKELMEMEALKQAGIAEIEIDKFKNGIVDIVVNVISKLI